MNSTHLVRLLGVARQRSLPTPPPTPLRLRTVPDVIALLHEQVEGVRNDPLVPPTEKARVIGRLAGLALKAIEVGNLAARVEMLEMVLKQRAAEGKP